MCLYSEGKFRKDSDYRICTQLKSGHYQIKMIVEKYDTITKAIHCINVFNSPSGIGGCKT